MKQIEVVAAIIHHEGKFLAARWIGPEELHTVEWLPADVEVVRKLKDER